MSDYFLDVDRALERSIAPGKNAFTGYDSALAAYEPRPKAPKPVDHEYVRKVTEGAREKAERARAMVVLKAGTPEQRAEVLAQLRKGEPAKGRAYQATRAVGFPGLTLHAGGVVEVSDQSFSNRHLQPVEAWTGDYPVSDTGTHIYLLIQGER